LPLFADSRREGGLVRNVEGLGDVLNRIVVGDEGRAKFECQGEEISVRRRDSRVVAGSLARRSDLCDHSGVGRKDPDVGREERFECRRELMSVQLRKDRRHSVELSNKLKAGKEGGRVEDALHGASRRWTFSRFPAQLTGNAARPIVS
jgi:hypothetical protein